MDEVQEEDPAMNKETDSSHSIYFVLPVEAFTTENPCSLKFDCKTDCNVLPTTWTLEIVYENQKDSFKFSLSVNLTRNDHTHAKQVTARVCLSCLDAKSRLVRFSQDLIDVFMNNGDKVQGCVKESRCLLSALKITLLIKNCH